jgi:hypothetical protein
MDGNTQYLVRRPAEALAQLPSRASSVYGVVGETEKRVLVAPVSGKT